mmetsp:Transcript_2136/g.3824  ORF Transcript_2136/g.3824 Transcript_2136/m.3824 type:complete len:83 (+) Transcript_2136:332-580(+)
MSEGSPKRASPVVLAMLSSPTALMVPRIIRDIKGPGHMQFDVTCRDATAPAKCLESITTAALLVLYAKVSISGGCKPFTDEM